MFLLPMDKQPRRRSRRDLQKNEERGRKSAYEGAAESENKGRSLIQERAIQITYRGDCG